MADLIPMPNERPSAPQWVVALVAGLLVAVVAAAVVGGLVVSLSSSRSLDAASEIIERRTVTIDFLNAEARHQQCIEGYRSAYFATQARVVAALIAQDFDAMAAERVEFLSLAEDQQQLTSLCPAPYVEGEGETARVVEPPPTGR